jgi:hypothetical protein
MIPSMMKEPEMARHRFLELVNRPVHTSAVAPAACGAFMACPGVLQAGLPSDMRSWQERLYAWAFEQAQAVVRPSVVERLSRDLLN